MDVSGEAWNLRDRGKLLFDKRAGRCRTVSSAGSTGSVGFRNNFIQGSVEVGEHVILEIACAT